MHGLPYINKSNLEAANVEAKRIIESPEAATLATTKAAEFSTAVDEALKRAQTKH